MSHKHITLDEINAMEKRFRVHFINSLSGYKSANLIGTIDQYGVTNLSIVSSVIHLGADPALVAFINRPHTVERNTLDNIYTAEQFTINHVPRDHFEQAHHTSARYEADISEFDMAGLSEQYTEMKAPYVAESRVKIGVAFKQKVDIELNGTVLIIGQIIEVLLDDSILQSDGKLDLIKADTVAVSGLDEYHSATSLGRLEYAKPKR